MSLLQCVQNKNEFESDDFLNTRSQVKHDLLFDTSQLKFCQLCVLPLSNVPRHKYTIDRRSRRRRKKRLQQIIKTIAETSKRWDGWNMYAIISKFRRLWESERERESATQKRYLGRRKFQGLPFSLASYETEIYPIENNIFCINSFRARNPIMPCNYWMWISCDHFDAVEWMCCRTSIILPKYTYVYACMHVYHWLRGKRWLSTNHESGETRVKLKVHHTFICSSVIQFWVENR